MISPLELLVDRYDNVLRDTMDILAPVKSRTIVLRPNAPWYNEDIGNEKRKLPRLVPSRWRSSRLESDRSLSYTEQCSVVNTMLYKAKELYDSSVIQDNAHDTRLLFRSIDKLLQRQTEKHYPSADNIQQLAIAFADFFTAKMERIREELVLRKSGLVHSPSLAKSTCLERLSEFHLVSGEDVLKLIRSSTIKACKLDPLLATIMRSCLSALVPVFKTVISLSLSTRSVPEDLKIASLRPLLKKPNADCEQFSNFRPVSNLKFVSKLVEKSVFAQLNNYLTVHGLQERFQSSHKAHHSIETALLTITNDILLSLDSRDKVFLLLLDLSAAFDTVNHSLLLSRLKNSFGITGTVLQWFHSYLSGRSQFVEINDTKSSVRDLSVGVPQGSFLGPILYLLYTTSLSEIIRNHGLDYHFYADGTQLYTSFKDCDVDVARLIVENCVAGVCHWMDVNELKLNHDRQKLCLFPRSTIPVHSSATSV